MTAPDTSDNVLKIFIGEEFKIKVEGPEDFSGSYFLDTYDRAAEAVLEIVKNTEQYHLLQKKLKDHSDQFFDQSDFNNVIAFEGERGSGKSSAMLSMANFFVDSSAFSPQKNTGTNLQKLKERNLEFKVMPRVDPTLFEDGENILRNVIATMFSQFKEKINKNGQQDRPFHERSKVVQAFQKAYEGFQNISREDKDTFLHHKSSESSLDTLEGLAGSTRLRESFMALVEEYLKFSIGENTDKPLDKARKYLVVPIDDLDMNMKNAYEVIEDVRRYLMVPNVVLLMAIKVDQLRDMVVKEYDAQYKSFYDLSKPPVASTEDMANRYLEKIMPPARRLLLPGILSNISLKIFFGEKKDYTRSDDEKLHSIQDTVLGYLYDAIGILFLKPRSGVHPLVPPNLRDLQNFLTFLRKISKGSNPTQRFKEYLVNAWMANNLTANQIRFLRDMMALDHSYWNQFVITEYFSGLSSEGDPNGIKQKEELKAAYQGSMEKLMSRKNNPLNMSMGDVLFFLKKSAEYLGRKVSTFNFAIKALYTIEMQLGIQNKTSSIPEGLIAGRVFAYDLEEESLVPRWEGPKEIQKLERTHFKVLNITQIPLRLPESMEEKLTDEKDSAKIGNFTDVRKWLGDKQKTDPEDQLSSPRFELFQEIEFTLSLVYFQNTLEGNFRDKNSPFYAQPLKNSSSLTGHFDGLAWLFNFLNPKRNHQRIFSPAGKEGESRLYQEFQKKSLFLDSETGSNQYLDRFGIFYNIELLEYFFNYLPSHWDRKFKTTQDQDKVISATVSTIFGALEEALRNAIEGNEYLKNKLKNELDLDKWSFAGAFKEIFEQLNETSDGTVPLLIDEWNAYREISIKGETMPLKDLPKETKLIANPIRHELRETLEGMNLDPKDRQDRLNSHLKNLNSVKSDGKWFSNKHYTWDEEYLEALIADLKSFSQKSDPIPSLEKRKDEIEQERKRAVDTYNGRIRKWIYQRRERLVKTTIEELDRILSKPGS